ncbi:hypothetical protein PUN28_003220 [Cardiocondyla obscurior]|uniref:Uncharacterized protein n=1 Tax=Cardiocondyla obscurior TaxID=286306 RepID=A0AAW2GIL0_9HYME
MLINYPAFPRVTNAMKEAYSERTKRPTLRGRGGLKEASYIGGATSRIVMASELRRCPLIGESHTFL